MGNSNRPLNQSFMFTNITETGLSGRLEFPIDSLQFAIREQKPDFILDQVLVTDSQWQIIEPYIRHHLHISQGGVEYQLEFGERDTLEIEIADYLVVQYVAKAPGPIPEKIFISFSAIIHAIGSSVRL